MTELERWGFPPMPDKPQLSGGARFLRGFRRIGLAVSLPVLAVGVAIAAGAAHQEALEPVNRYRQLRCLDERGYWRFQAVSYEAVKASGCTGPLYNTTGELIIHSRVMPSVDYWKSIQDPLVLNVGIAIAVAAISYVFFWILGWIAAGFTRD